MDPNFKTSAFFQEWINFVYQLQNEICFALETVDNSHKFVEDLWQRQGGGGGRTRVLANGKVIEKGGVNVSFVHGTVTDLMRNQLKINGEYWAACGLSMVIHPFNPFAPTFHANWRFFELYDTQQNVADAWFGGGMDLTPYYIFPEDAQLFHSEIKNAMQSFGNDLYPNFKKQCDAYFNNHHRGVETRGIGGVFYDHLRPNDPNGMNQNQLFQFQKANAESFFKTYIPILQKRKNQDFTDKNKYWQEIRRGRYVEFNLLHDRGTLFGLKTHGRIESILMSLPPTVRYDYNFQPKPGSEEERALNIFKNPKDWV
ncbi:MAG: oxygen-dependent coproporphyrinogen oxidase [Flavobacteriaceae bacterium]|nr:oxygen-dependent coproporphyrinogen oxidase [Flavobacteriaceae bacterium]